MTTVPQFFAMLYRFIACCGVQSLITSENAKTFLATKKHLKKIGSEEPQNREKAEG